MLAAKPEYFAHSGTRRRYPTPNERAPYSMTHKGLKLHLPHHVVEGTTRIVLPLACAYEEEKSPIAVILYMRLGRSWARLQCEELMTAPTKVLWTRRDCSYTDKATIYVSQPDMIAQTKDELSNDGCTYNLIFISRFLSAVYVSLSAGNSVPSASLVSRTSMFVVLVKPGRAHRTLFGAHRVVFAPIVYIPRHVPVVVSPGRYWKTLAWGEEESQGGKELDFLPA
jgi:hypothetical protein